MKGSSRKLLQLIGWALKHIELCFLLHHIQWVSKPVHKSHHLTWQSWGTKTWSGIISGNLSMYMNSLLQFSLKIADRSTISHLSVYIQRSPELTLLRLSRQKGHDWDRPRLRLKQTNTACNTDRCNRMQMQVNTEPLTVWESSFNYTLQSGEKALLPSYMSMSTRKLNAHSINSNKKCTRNLIDCHH